jgi:hypothetical protein
VVCSSTITERRHRMRQQIQVLGFYLAIFLCLVLTVLKLTIEGHWSWWRVLLPLSVVLGHNALYITVEFVWLFFVDDGAAGEDVMIQQDDGPYSYQLAATLCFLIFADNLLGRIEGRGETVWLWLFGQIGADLRLWCSVCCASFCSGLGLYLRVIAEPAESSSPPQSKIPSPSNTVLGIMDSMSFLTKGAQKFAINS